MIGVDTPENSKPVADDLLWINSAFKWQYISMVTFSGPVFSITLVSDLKFLAAARIVIDFTGHFVPFPNLIVGFSCVLPLAMMLISTLIWEYIILLYLSLCRANIQHIAT